MQIRRGTGCLLVLCLPALFAQAPRSRILFSFEPNEDISRIKAVDAHIERTQDHATDGGYSLVLSIHPSERPDATLPAGGELCDVVSFNIYRPKVVPSDWTVLSGIDKPVLIGEFHMGALDRGMFHTGLVPSEDQADRARMYQEYIRSMVDHPLMVGCHYFKYADEPLTGRPGDGENYNIGVVSVTDTPYPEFLAAAKAVHAEAYQRRAGRIDLR